MACYEENSERMEVASRDDCTGGRGCWRCRGSLWKKFGRRQRLTDMAVDGAWGAWTMWIECTNRMRPSSALTRICKSRAGIGGAGLVGSA